MFVCFSLSNGLLVVHRLVYDNTINGNYKFRYILPWPMLALIFKSLPYSGLVIHSQSSSQPNYHKTAIIISYSQDCQINTEIRKNCYFSFLIDVSLLSKGYLYQMLLSGNIRKTLKGHFKVICSFWHFKYINLSR